MRELVTIDLSDLYSRRLAEPGKQASGRRLELSNDQEWYLWTLRDHCTLRTFADDLKIGRDKISDTLKRLKDQGGPQGKKPEWVK